MDEPMTFAMVAGLYGALVVAAIPLVLGKYILMQKLLLAVVVLINLRYMVFGVAPAIAWITNVADIFNYLFISQSTNCEEVPTLATLPSNENSLLSMYTYHPTWANQLYFHFPSGMNYSTLILHVHVIFQTACLALSFFHIFMVKQFGSMKRLLGQLSAWCGVVGLTTALMVGLEDGKVESYGGMRSVYGWIWMAGSGFFLMGKGVLAVLQKDISSHKRWMTRYYVSMWCDFLIFRLMLIVVTPLFSECQSCAMLLCIWGAPTIGLLLGQVVLSAGFLEEDSKWTSQYKKPC